MRGIPWILRDSASFHKGMWKTAPAQEEKPVPPGCTKKCKLFVKFAGSFLRDQAKSAILQTESLGKEECEMMQYFAARSDDLDDMIFPDDTWTRSER